MQATSALRVTHDFRLLTGPNPARGGPTADGIRTDDTVEFRPRSKSTQAPTLELPLVPPPPPPPAAVPQGPLSFEEGFPGALGSGPPPLTAQAIGNSPKVIPQFEAHPGQVMIDQKALHHALQLELGGVDAARLQYVDDLSMPQGKLPSPAELKRVSNAFHDASSIPFEYITDGCYARAHLMCESLKQHGINHQKIFVFGQLGAKNDLQNVTWWYHVAPLVFVQDPQSGAVDARVVDPGLSRDPMTPQDWIKAINKGSEVQIDLTQSSQYFPRSTNGVQGNFDENLQAAADTLKNYAKALRKIRPPDFVGPVRFGPFADGHIKDGDRVVELFPNGLNVKGNPGAPEPSRRTFLERLGDAWRSFGSG